MQGCRATGKSSKGQAGRARTVLRGTSCPQRRPVDQPPHPEGSHTTVVPFYPAPLLTSLVFLSTPPWPDTRRQRYRLSQSHSLIPQPRLRDAQNEVEHKTAADVGTRPPEVA